MTEKQYGGSSSFGFKETALKNKDINTVTTSKKTIFNQEDEEDSYHLTAEEISKLKKAGKIASETVKFARAFIKKDMPLLEIAEKIEQKICELGGKPAFPVNLSINEIAAHTTPAYNDSSLAYGLLKVDLGAHVEGYVADTAVSIDLENNEENKALIASAEKALSKAIEKVTLSNTIRDIGSTIEKNIKAEGFYPIANLSGHSIEQYILHAGINIPNYDNAQEKKLQPGVYAVEPFATSGLGSVRDGKASGIYHLEKEGSVRDSFARIVLEFINEEYHTLPFCTRWIYKKFGARGLLGLKRIEEASLLHHHHQLIEVGKGKVAQAEHTIILTEKEKIITTL